MRKNIQGDYLTKAKKREHKKRPRMLMHGRALRAPSRHGGKKLSGR